MKEKRIKFFNDSNQNIRVDNYLSLRIEDMSRTKLKKIILSGNVLVDGLTVKPSMILSGGEQITCNLDMDNDDIVLEPENIKLDIIYEDKFFIVINKPAGMVVHPGNGNRKSTLANGLLYHFNKNLSDLNSVRPGIVHRLDKDTSGVIVIAKDNRTHQLLSDLFKKRKIVKTYDAIIWGSPLKNKGKIVNFIKRDSRNKTIFRVSDIEGKEAITKYELLNNYGPLSTVRLHPKTGRTHQLRVHMKSIGHPILGDDKYSGGVQKIKSFHTQYSQLLRRSFKIIDRHMLHASSIRFIHPFSKKNVCFSADIPSDIEKIIKLWS